MVKLIILLSLLVCGVAYANEDGDPYISSEFPNCARLNEPTAASILEGRDGPCCPGLEMNANTNLCDVKLIEDSFTTNCTNNGSCAPGLGCFPQLAKKMFSETSPNQNLDENALNQSLLSMQTDESSFLADGANCTHASQCSSYSCVAQKCQEKLVCRFAGHDEIAPIGVNCAPGMIRMSSGLCQNQNEETVQVFNGLPFNFEVNTNSSCQFNVNETNKELAHESMLNNRGMEFLFASTNISDGDDCFKTIPLLKDQIGLEFHKRRKELLHQYSEDITNLEKNFKTLIAASEDSQDNVSIHGESISQSKLASRQTSGYDSLMLMLQRNQIMIRYETQMKQLVDATNVKISKLSTGMATWNNEDSQWNNGSDAVIQNHACGAKYKKWILSLGKMGWDHRVHSNTGNRWTTYFEMHGNSGANSAIIERPVIKKHLIELLGSESAYNKLKSPRVYLMDPFMYGGASMNSYGTSHSFSATGLFGLGTKDKRSYRVLNGQGSGSLTRIYNDLKPKIKEFYTNMRASDAPAGFIYEPEATELAKECLSPEKISELNLTPKELQKNSAACAKYESFLTDVLDKSFAKWIAYSVHPTALLQSSSIFGFKPSYHNYFTRANSGRRRLFGQMEVEMHSLSKYYEEVVTARSKQNECISKVIKGIKDSGILASNNNGILEGSYYDPGAGSTAGAGAGSINPSNGANNIVKNKLNVSHELNFSGSLNSTSGKTNSDSVAGGKSQSFSSAQVESNRAFLAARNKQMLKSNETAISKGMKIFSSSKSNIQIGKASDSSDSASVAATTSPSDSADLNASPAHTEPVNTGNEIGMTSKVDLMPNFPRGNQENFGSNVSGSMSDSSSETSTNEKNDYIDLDGEFSGRSIVNKKDFQAAEDDSLFKILSKAYTRNLDRVLTRKKSID